MYFSKPTTALYNSLLTLLSITPILAAPASTSTQLDATTLQQIDTFARYSSAAYCRNVIDSAVNSTVCSNQPLSSCGLLADATTVAEFNGDRTISGYIAVSKGQKLIVVSFRGTDPNSFRDFMNDIKICLRDPRSLLTGLKNTVKALCGVLPNTPPDENDKVLPLCDNCTVHTGFWTAFRGIKDETMRVINQQRQQNPGFAVVTTGHSLGGAVATITGAYIRKSGINTDIYTYGSPRVGDAAFAAFVSTQPNGKTFRITNGADPVTVIPGIVAGYAHTTPEFWFPNRAEQPDNMQICEGVSNVSCSAQFLASPFKLGDHSSSKYTKGFDACPEPKGRTMDPEKPDIITAEDLDQWKRQGLVDNSTTPITKG